MGASGYSLLRPQRGITALPAVRNRPEVATRRYLTAGRELLIQVILVAFPSMGLVSAGHLHLAALWMWGLTGVMSLRLVLLGRPEELGCLLIATAPVVNFLRGAMLYSGVPVLYLGAVAYFALTAPAKTWEVARRNPAALILFAASFIYYVASAWVTADPRNNIRVFEMAGAVVIILLIGPPKRGLAATLVGTLVSSLAVGIGAYAFIGSEANERLGIVLTEEGAVGNPFALGMPLALGVLALCVDGGSWLGMQRRPWLRITLLVPTLFLLAQSSSRAGQLAAIAGLVAAAVLSRSNRFAIIAWLAGIALAGFVLLQFAFASSFQREFERTFGEGRTLERASSGRSDQWHTFWHAWTDNPVNFLVGYGIGSEREVNASVSARVSQTSHAGARLDFHALAMHIGIEFGLLGLLFLLLWTSLVAWRCVRRGRATGVILPACCLLAYLIGALTASGFDTVSGMLLGVGLLRTGLLRNLPGTHPRQTGGAGLPGPSPAAI